MYCLLFFLFLGVHLPNYSQTMFRVKSEQILQLKVKLHKLILWFQMFTDGAFIAASLESARRHSNTTYFYFYDHHNQHSYDEHLGNVTDEFGKRRYINKKLSITKLSANKRRKIFIHYHIAGVSHGDELISLFNLRGLFPCINESSTADYAVSQRMIHYWVNFIRNGFVLSSRKNFESSIFHKYVNVPF